MYSCFGSLLLDWLLFVGSGCCQFDLLAVTVLGGCRDDARSVPPQGPGVLVALVTTGDPGGCPRWMTYVRCRRPC